MDQAYCDALRFAFDYEKKGEEHYRQAAEWATDKFAKQALTFLADEEVEHIRKIDEFNRHLLERSDFDIDAECRVSLPERVEAFLEEARLAGQIGDERVLSDIDVYDKAMANEKEGYEMYAAAEDSSDEDRLKRFFAFLADEEQTHYQLLAASRKYLEDPSYYFEEGGGWLFG
jgi:rubrerythrin